MVHGVRRNLIGEHLTELTEQRGLLRLNEGQQVERKVGRLLFIEVTKDCPQLCRELSGIPGRGHPSVKAKCGELPFQHSRSIQKHTRWRHRTREHFGGL